MRCSLTVHNQSCQATVRSRPGIVGCFGQVNNDVLSEHCNNLFGSNLLDSRTTAVFPCECLVCSSFSSVDTTAATSIGCRSSLHFSWQACLKVGITLSYAFLMRHWDRRRRSEDFKGARSPAFQPGTLGVVHKVASVAGLIYQDSALFNCLPPVSTLNCRRCLKHYSLNQELNGSMAAMASSGLVKKRVLERPHEDRSQSWQCYCFTFLVFWAHNAFDAHNPGAN